MSWTRMMILKLHCIETFVYFLTLILTIPPPTPLQHIHRILSHMIYLIPTLYPSDVLKKEKGKLLYTRFKENDQLDYWTNDKNSNKRFFKDKCDWPDDQPGGKKNFTRTVWGKKNLKRQEWHLVGRKFVCTFLSEFNFICLQYWWIDDFAVCCIISSFCCCCCCCCLFVCLFIS